METFVYYPEFEIRTATVRLEAAMAAYSSAWATLQVFATYESSNRYLDFAPTVWRMLDELAEAASKLSRLHLELKARAEAKRAAQAHKAEVLAGLVPSKGVEAVSECRPDESGCPPPF